jgi:predicted transcriptional regulator
MQKKLYERWKEFRKFNNASIQDVSMMTGISRNMISLFERGKASISVDKFEKMIEALDGKLVIKKEM